MTFGTRFGFDISTYNDASTTAAVIDFQKMKAYGAEFVIIRIGQGNFTDQDYFTNIKNSRGILPRGVYWYYDPLFDPKQQAQLCLTTLGNEQIEGRTWLDLEFTWTGNYQAPTHWKTFCDTILQAGKRLGIYTRKSWWDTRVGSLSGYFSQFPLWCAQYNTALTLIPNSWTKAMLWQDGTPAVGQAAGVESLEIDHNFWNIDFDFKTEWGVVESEPIHTQPFPNVDEYIEIVNGMKCHITLVTLNEQTRFHVKHFGGMLGYVSQSQAQIAFNGQDYNKATNSKEPFYPQGMAYSDGKKYTERQDYQYWLNVSSLNAIAADYRLMIGYYNATSFIRPLVVNSVQHSALSDISKIENTELHARSVLGYTKNGRLMQIVAEGKYPLTGVTLPQVAQLGIKYGAEFLGEHGGGGDAAKAINGVLVNTTSDPTERPVPQVIELFIGGDMTRYTATALGDNTKLRPNHNTLSDFNPVKAYKSGTKFHGDELWIANATNKDVSQSIGDTWLFVSDVDGVASSAAWVAIIHQGKPICTLLDSGMPSPAPATDNITVTVTDSTTGAIKTYSIDGTLTVK